MNSSQDIETIYFPFLDRELCLASGSYFFPDCVFADTFDICMFMSVEPVVMSAGNLLEHKAYEVIYPRRKLWFSGQGVILLSGHRSLFEVTYEKRAQYGHVINDPDTTRDYNRYANDDWQSIFNGPLHFKGKTFDTTDLIRESLLRNFGNQNDVVGRYLAEVIDRNPRAALTVEVFRQSNFFEPSVLDWISRRISESYTIAYTNSEKSAVFSGTGLISSNFDECAAQSFYFPIFRTAFQIFDLTQKFWQSDYEWCCFRGNSEHRQFVDIIRTLARALGPEDVRRFNHLLLALFSRSERTSREGEDVAERVRSVNIKFENYGFGDFEWLYKDVLQVLRRRLVGMRRNRIFVVHGRDWKANNALFDFLGRLGLDHMEFEEAKSLACEETGEASPYIGDILNSAMKHAQGIIVLLTPDEEILLKKELRSEPGDEKRRASSRPNVLFEAGMALAMYPEKTILVKMGNTEIPTDILGRHYVSLSNSATSKSKLRNRIASLGVVIPDGKERWLDLEIEYTKKSSDTEALSKPKVYK